MRAYVPMMSIDTGRNSECRVTVELYAAWPTVVDRISQEKKKFRSR